MSTGAPAPGRAVLVRHAHADWPHYAGQDFDRPLTARGERDALAAARAMAAAGLFPVRVLVSPALRTRQTGGIIAAELALPDSALQYIDALYNAPADVLADALCSARRTTPGILMLVAHNPGISQLARELAGAPEAPGFAPADWRVLALE